MSLVLFASLALQLTVPEPPRRPPIETVETALVDSLEAVQRRFIYEWRQLFYRSAVEREKEEYPTERGAPTALSTQVNALLGCNPSYSWSIAAQQRIFSRSSNLVVCPSWSLPLRTWYDARFLPDAALSAPFHAPVRQARASLAQLFERARTAHPTNDWIAGQSVRLYLENGELELALQSARQCRANPQWCAALEASVLAQLGQVKLADDFFEQSLRPTLPGYCAWTDLEVLLDSTAGGEYRRRPCGAARDSLNRVIWWLSDPLWSEEGNPRRAEHYSRHVGLSLRSAIDRDERIDWRESTGGDALREMVVRYGWWSRSVGYGAARHLDQTVLGYQVYPHIRSSIATFEYTKGRVHALPAWRAIERPFEARSTDWELSDMGTTPAPRPPAHQTDRRTREIQTLLDQQGVWWPREHFEPNTPLEQFHDGQTALLRRQSGAVLATAYALGSALGGDKRRLRSTTIRSTGPDAFETISTDSTTAEGVLRVQVFVPAEPAVVSVEVPSDSTIGAPAGRVRFGISPPRALSALAPGEVAVSDPVLLHSTPPDLRARDALGTMLGSTTLAGASQLGIYWELYGMAADAEAEFSVRLERYTSESAVRRMGIMMGLATSQNVAVVSSWSGVAGVGGDIIEPGPVPVIGRTLQLDISRVAAGEYWLDVGVRLRDGREVFSRRQMTVRR